MFFEMLEPPRETISKPESKGQLLVTTISPFGFEQAKLFLQKRNTMPTFKEHSRHTHSTTEHLTVRSLLSQ